MKDFFARIMPSTEVEAVRDVFKEENAARLLAGNPDFVVDAIDNKVTKASLIKYCFDRKLKIISCMGAGGKVDPTKVQLGRLTHTRNDPLCKTMRLVLRRLKVDI